MTQADIDNHLEISERLLQHAYEQFEADDLLQASEKAWGAVAQGMEKFVALGPLKSVAKFRNFYEDQLDDREVAEGVGWARELIWQLESNARSPLGERPSHLRRRGRST